MFHCQMSSFQTYGLFSKPFDFKIEAVGCGAIVVPTVHIQTWRGKEKKREGKGDCVRKKERERGREREREERERDWERDWKNRDRSTNQSLHLGTHAPAWLKSQAHLTQPVPKRKGKRLADAPAIPHSTWTSWVEAGTAGYSALGVLEAPRASKSPMRSERGTWEPNTCLGSLGMRPSSKYTR